MNKTRTSVEDKQSQWRTVNESVRKEKHVQSKNKWMKECKSGKKISSICSESLLKSPINLKNTSQPTRPQTWTVFGLRTWLSIEKKQKTYRLRRNTTWNTENKKIRRHFSSIMQHCVQTKHHREMNKSWLSSFRRKVTSESERTMFG